MIESRSGLSVTAAHWRVCRVHQHGRPRGLVRQSVRRAPVETVKYEEVCLKAYATISEAKESIGDILRSTTSAGRTRRLTAKRRMRPTSIHCRSPKRHKPGRIPLTYETGRDCSNRWDHFS